MKKKIPKKVKEMLDKTTNLTLTNVYNYISIAYGDTCGYDNWLLKFKSFLDTQKKEVK